MSCEALLAMPERPLCEPSHRSPKKDRPKSLSFCSDNTVTDDQQAAPVHSGRHFLDLGLIAAVTVRTDACPTPSGHKVRRIAADIRNGSIASFWPRAGHFRFAPESGLKSDIAGGPFRANNGSGLYYSITSSTAASGPAGTVRPSVLAVRRLMTKSNLVGCKTGCNAERCAQSESSKKLVISLLNGE